MENILFISVHPDDETIGCGGTIIKHKKNGDTIFWLILTNIDTEHGWDQQVVEKRQKEIDIVSKRYGFSETFKLNFPTTMLDATPKSVLINSISKIISKVKPDVIYLPNRSDVHSDHKVAFDVSFSCTKNFRYPFIKRILMYECLSETEFAPALNEYSFTPNVFINISDSFQNKIEIMKTYESEIMNDFLPRSISTIEALAKYRGSRISCKYAEAFVLLFESL